MNLLAKISLGLRFVILAVLAAIIFVVLVSSALRKDRAEGPSDVESIQCRAQCERELPPEVLVGGGVRGDECLCVIRIGRPSYQE